MLVTSIIYTYWFIIYTFPMSCHHWLLWLSQLYSMIATGELKNMLYELYDWCCCAWFLNVLPSVYAFEFVWLCFSYPSCYVWVYACIYRFLQRTSDYMSIFIYVMSGFMCVWPILLPSMTCISYKLPSITFYDLYCCLLWPARQCDLYESIIFEVQIIWHASVIYVSQLDLKFKFPHPPSIYMWFYASMYRFLWHARYLFL